MYAVHCWNSVCIICDCTVQLPKEPEVSCLCGSKSVKATVCITNTTFKDCASKSVSINDAVLSIDFPSAHCSKTYNVSLAFNNSEGISDFSDVHVSRPTGGEVCPFNMYVAFPITACLMNALKYRTFSVCESLKAHMLDL